MQSERGFLSQIRFSHGLSLWAATARGLDVIIVTIVFVLLGDVVTSAGSLSVLAFLLVALLVLVNVLGYIELSSGLARSGNAYALVRERTRGGGLSFFAGWLLALSGLGLCALLAQSAARYLGALAQNIWGLSFPFTPAAMVLVLLITLVNTLHRRVGRGQLFSLLVVLLLVLLALLSLPQVRVEHYALEHPRLGEATSLLLAAFIGLEIITGRQREVRARAVGLTSALIVTLVVTVVLGAGLAAAVVGVVGPQATSLAGIALLPAGEAVAGSNGQVVVLLMGSAALLLALGRVLTLVVRQLYVMSRDGFFSPGLHRPYFRHGIPLRLMLLVACLVLPLMYIPTPLLSRVSGLLYLFVLMLVNLVLILRLPRTEADVAAAVVPARSSLSGMIFRLWAPSLTLLVDVVVVFLWGWQPLVWVLAGLLLGGLYFLVYGRGHYLAAQEGVTIFRPPKEERKPAELFRVLVPVANPSTAGALVRVAGQVAQSQGGEALALQVVVVPEPVPLESGRYRARVGSALLEKALTMARDEGLPVQAMTRVARSAAQGILEAAAEEKADLILMGWRGPVRPRSASLGSVVDTVLRDAPSDVLIMQGKGDMALKRILVPTAGGPHARVAARLANLLGRAWGSEVTLLYVQRGPASPEQLEENKQRIAETLEGLFWEEPPGQKIVQAASVVEGIVQEARSYDLVLLGVSEESALDQFVFGNLPLQVAAQVPAAALVQGYHGLTELWGKRFLRAVLGLLPVLGDEERLEAGQEIGRGAQPGINYYVLIVLSCVIAALGLLLNSPAVVIGAMLVAPLMSPILALSYGLIQGDLWVIRFATEAIFRGVALSLVIAVMIGFLSPLKIVTTEMQARAQPTLLDMGVALASGMAGAYAMTRKDVSAALPGVAIAAALMPPLATVGVALSLGELRVAGGALLLFVTNIAAISLAGAVVFFALGLRPQKWEPESRRRLRRGLVVSLVLLLALSVPLALILRGIVRDIAQERAIREVLSTNLEAQDVHLVTLEIDRQEDGLLIVATVRSVQVLAQEEADNLSRLLQERLGLPVRLEIVVLPVVRSDLPIPVSTVLYA